MILASVFELDLRDCNRHLEGGGPRGGTGRVGLFNR